MNVYKLQLLGLKGFGVWYIQEVLLEEVRTLRNGSSKGFLGRQRKIIYGWMYCYLLKVKVMNVQINKG